MICARCGIAHLSEIPHFCVNKHLPKTRYQEIQEACSAFHEANPEVWDLFVRFTLQRIQQGYEHYSVAAIFERVRWETDKGADSPALKLNNNFRAFYARRFAAWYPVQKDFFRTRVQKSAHRRGTGRPEPTREELQ